MNKSDDPSALIATALENGNYAILENTLAKLVEQNPASPHLLTFLARIFLMDGKPLNCAVALKKSEKLQPLSEPDEYTLALCYVAMEKPEWASRELDKLAHSYPGNALYPYWQGRIAYDRYAYAEAVEKFRKALELDPTLVRAYDNLGLCYEALSNNDLALKNYEHGVSLNRQSPTPSPWPPLNFGMLLLKQGSLEKAEPALREAVRFGPMLPQAHHQLGILLGKLKNFPGATIELKKANELDPTYAESHFTLAHIYRQMGDQEKADAEAAAFQSLKQARKQNVDLTGAARSSDKPPQ